MIEFIERNLQMILTGVVVLGAGIYALTGFYRDGADEDEARIAYDRRKGLRSLAIGSGALLLVSAFAFIPAGYRGVVFDRGSGVEQNERPEGVSLVVPFWQRLVVMSVRTQVFDYEAFVQTNDLQEVTLPIAVNYHVDPTSAAQVYQELGFDYASIVIEPAVFQAATQAAGQIIAEDVAASRAALAQAIQDIIVDRLAFRGLIVESVSVKDAVFDSEFIASIKAKVIAEQKAAESLRLVEVARNEAEQVRLRAVGDAQALAAVGEGQSEAIAEVAKALGFTPNEYLEWLRTTKWDGAVPGVVLGDSSQTIIPIPAP